MDYALQLILKQINHELICLIDGSEMVFSSGNEAIAHLQKENKHYSPLNILARDNVVVVEIRDTTEGIKKSCHEFIAEHKKRFGHEPNLFDGV